MPLFNDYAQIPAPRNVRGFGFEAHFIEKPRALQAHFGVLHQVQIKHVARSKSKLAQNDFAFGFGVALNVYRLQIEFFALVNFNYEVDFPLFQIRAAQCPDIGVEIAELSVKVFNPIHGAVNQSRREDVARLNVQALVKRF